MNLKLLAIPLTFTGGVGGIYLGYKYLYHNRDEKKSIKTKLGDLLLKFDDSFSEKWKTRAVFVSSKDNLPESLRKLRSSSASKTISESEIKGWCQKQINQVFSSEIDPLFVNVRNYCTFNNKDKLGEKVISEELKQDGGIQESGKWSKANKKLTDASVDGMSGTIKAVKTKISGSSGITTDTKALKNWCEDIYTSYFKGDSDPDFRDAKIYCVES